MRASVEQHIALVRELVGERLRGSESVPIDAALGRILPVEVVSPVDLPLFRNSQMDGFAVRAADVIEVPATLQVVGDIPAGPATPPALEAGQAMRIMTGAVVPEGADAVVPVEDTTVDGDIVTIARSRAAGEFVRDRGSDLRAGAPILPAGLTVASRHIGALAAAGVRSVEVVRRPRIGVITTGSELSDEPAEPGQIFDANQPALVAAITAAGGEPSFIGRVIDDHTAFREFLPFALRASDVVVTSGGISMGDYEVVREVLGPLGASIGTVAMQPGGPQATAVVDGVPVLCFPGNPVSTQLSFELFLAPLVREAAGLPAARRGLRVLAHDIRSVPGKRQFLRGRLVGADAVEQIGGPSSHLVAALAAADCLIDVPVDTLQLAAGDPVEVWEL
jgi:molybdopterin molybdotransferase